MNSLSTEKSHDNQMHMPHKMLKTHVLWWSDQELNDEEYEKIIRMNNESLANVLAKKLKVH